MTNVPQKTTGPRSNPIFVNATLLQIYAFLPSISSPVDILAKIIAFFELFTFYFV